MPRFEGKVVLVTGAASGIGRATALRLTEEGARVFCVDINGEGAEVVAATLKDAAAQRTDVRDAAECDAVVAAAQARYGRLDGLANVAGVGSFGHVEHTSDDEWQRVIGINLTGVFQMTRAALPLLEAHKGAIVNIASVAGLVATPYAAAYSASKSGVVGLTRTVAVEYARRGVRVNAICPSAVDTPLIAGALDGIEGLDMNLMARLTPLIADAAQPEDVASVVAFLLSDDARFVTGAMLAVDGGHTAI